MWMQQSMENASLHQRNRFAGFGNSYPSGQSGGSYTHGSGSGGHDAGNNGDWKSKILEGGQWLGGKVIEYGGKLARGASHDSIPDHMAQQPRNDGRASWMADIRGASSSFSNNSYSNGGVGAGGNTYQNDFATERPKPYSDYSASSSSLAPGRDYASKPLEDYSRSRSKSKDHHDRHKPSTKTKRHADSKRGKRQQASTSRTVLVRLGLGPVVC
ncbi:hypothetical protein PINS_up013988 [Pythium insidiosum]|nr:hypothetical protein PINS_up013988 [Pythium insidiosum]